VEKKGTKRSLLTEGHGLPIAIVVSGANTHDVKLLGKTLDNIVIYRPQPTPEKPQNLCLDAGYTGHEGDVNARMYIPHIRPRGEEKLLIECDPDFKPRRWVVEVTHSWINRFRKLLVKKKKKDSNYIALLCFAFSIIVWRKIIPVHKSPAIVG
jgi:putative transposase